MAVNKKLIHNYINKYNREEILLVQWLLYLWHVPKQDVFFNTTKYAILCNNNAIFRGNGVITQDYAHFWEFRDIA